MALVRVEAKLGNFANPDFDLLTIGVPCKHGHATAPDFDLDKWVFQKREGNCLAFFSTPF
jgi:hypothetical protein